MESATYTHTPCRRPGLDTFTGELILSNIKRVSVLTNSFKQFKKINYFQLLLWKKNNSNTKTWKIYYKKMKLQANNP